MQSVQVGPDPKTSMHSLRSLYQASCVDRQRRYVGITTCKAGIQSKGKHYGHWSSFVTTFRGLLRVFSLFLITHSCYDAVTRVTGGSPVTGMDNAS